MGKILMNEGGILITAEKFRISGKIFKINEIKGVRTTVKRPLFGPMALAVVAMSLLIARLFGGFLEGSVAAFFLIFLLFAGGALWRVRGVRYTVLLGTVGGEVKAYTGRDSGRIIRIVRSLNKAIMAKSKNI